MKDKPDVREGICDPGTLGFFSVFKKRPHAGQVGLELTMWLRRTSESPSSCFHFLCPDVTGMPCHAWLRIYKNLKNMVNDPGLPWNISLIPYLGI